MLLRFVQFVYISMRLISHTSAYRPESKLLVTEGDRWIMFKMGPVHARDNGQGVSDTESECTARYRDLLYARIGIECHRSHRNRPRGLWHIRQEIRGVGMPVHSRKIPGGLQVEFQIWVVQHLYDTINMKAILVPISFLRPGVSCSIITDYPMIISTLCSQ